MNFYRWPLSKRFQARALKYLALSLLACVFFPISAFAGTVAVNSGTTYQAISGFGASSQWVEGKITAALANIFWTDDSSQPPTSQVNGNVGLSILRIGIDDSGNSNWGTACGSATQALKINPNVRIFGSPGVRQPSGRTTTIPLAIIPVVTTAILEPTPINLTPRTMPLMPPT